MVSEECVVFSRNSTLVSRPVDMGSNVHRQTDSSRNDEFYTTSYKSVGAFYFSRHSKFHFKVNGSISCQHFMFLWLI